MAGRGYIETVLDRDERMLHRGHLHWFIYAPALGLLVAGANRRLRRNYGAGTSGRLWRADGDCRIARMGSGMDCARDN